jgi:regulator of sirC expression with transglutaminase-like and TPR domain
VSIKGYITSLIKLLDDEDIFISRSAYERLLGLGTDAIPVILEFRENASGHLKNLLDEIVDNLRYRKYVDDVISYFKSADKDIERGAFLVAKFAYPDLNFKEYSEILELMALDLKKRIYTKDNIFDIVGAVNKFFFFEKGFRGNYENYYEPDNVFINRVIDRRVGIPITLSLVYILVGKRANLPVYGVALPGHFVVRYESNGFEIYVDPFNKGRLMTKNDCEKLISQLGYAQRREYFMRATADDIVKRMLGNLALAYKNSGYVEKANKLIEIIKLIEVIDENLHTNG